MITVHLEVIVTKMFIVSTMFIIIGSPVHGNIGIASYSIDVKDVIIVICGLCALISNKSDNNNISLYKNFETCGSWTKDP